MTQISRSVKRMDFDDKIRGKARFADDYSSSSFYHAYIIRSTHAHARIVSIKVPDIPSDVWLARADDLAHNRVLVDVDDQLILNEEEVQYVGEAIAIVVAETKKKAQDFAAKIEIEYEPLPACFDMLESEEILHKKSFVKGNPDSAFAEAFEVFEEEFTTGYQEHAYMEPQSIVADFSDRESVSIIGSMQCPFYIHNALKLAFNLNDDAVSVEQATVGGGFGGKEEYPSVVALQAALASYVSAKPVKLIFDRPEDIVSSTKRHPAHIKYKTALTEHGDILGMDIEVTLDGGAYLGISTTVIERSILHCLGPYLVPNLRVDGSVRKTNKVVTGAFRGFGDPQTLFGIDTHLCHLARHLGLDPLEYRIKHAAEDNAETTTGATFRDPVPLKEMISNLVEKTKYKDKQKEYQTQTGRYRRGIGLGIVGRGCGFAGSAERDFLKPYVQIKKTADGTVFALAATTEIGQGTHTAFRKIIAKALELPLDRVRYEPPNTSVVPNSGPTNASRSIQSVGRLFQRAAERLKTDWIEGEEQLIEEHYRDEREILQPFDTETFLGEAFVTYSWSVTACEVLLDSLTGEVTLEKMWGLFDVGTIIDYNMVRGQMHGGMVQGYGYAALEKLEDIQGVLQQDRFSNYIIPTAADIGSISVDFIEVLYPGGPYGAKGAGELSFCGVPAAYVLAVENASNCSFTHVPLTAESILEAMLEEAR